MSHYPITLSVDTADLFLQLGGKHDEFALEVLDNIEDTLIFEHLQSRIARRSLNIDHLLSIIPTSYMKDYLADEEE